MVENISMAFPTFIRRLSLDLFRYFTKGARVDMALLWAGRARLNEREAYIRPGAEMVKTETAI